MTGPNQWIVASGSAYQVTLPAFDTDFLSGGVCTRNTAGGPVVLINEFEMTGNGSAISIGDQLRSWSWLHSSGAALYEVGMYEVGMCSASTNGHVLRVIQVQGYAQVVQR